jgi:hypothetical protein
MQVLYTSPTSPAPPTDTGDDNATIYFMDVKAGENFHHIQLDDPDRTTFFILGDLVIPAGSRHSGQAKESFYRELFQHFTPEKLRQMKGFFYIIQVEGHGRSLKVYSSLFNILPVYYFVAAGQYYISSGIEPIRQSCPFPFTINKKFLLEKLLFNYAFLNGTIIKDIHLLDANCYLELGEFGDRLEIKKHTAISDYFVSAPTPWKKSMGEMSDLYLDMVRDYLPDEFFYMTLTGGFDGRTNVAAALKYRKDFAAFSYGGANTPDILIPRMISEKTGIRYEPFLLDERYARGEFLPHALRLVEATDANAGISRAHYRYVAQQLGQREQREQLGQRVKHIVTGNFGSELMRSMHALGVMVSPRLFNIFSGTDPKQLQHTIVNDPNLQFLAFENFKNELNDLNEDILQYKKNFQPHFTLNQNFYVYMFEEVFRKYFGPEIILQADHQLYNRSPFLDFGFIRALFKTELAGVNNTFWESNPLVRFRGQVLYAHIIREAFPLLAQLPTDRLYKPADFFSMKGKINIAASYFSRKFFKKQGHDSPGYNRLCYQTHMDYFKQLEINSGIFAKKPLQNFMETGEWLHSQDLFSHLMSLIIYISRVK